MQRYSGLALTIAMFLVTALPAAGDSPFVDDGGNIHEEAIAKAADLGITKGCNPPTNDRYCPDRTVTRAQFAAFLVRALDLPRSDAHSFEDTRGSVFESDIATLAASGITKGCNPPENTRFCPGQRLTRGQLAALLTRALDLNTTQSDYFIDDDGTIFEDDINRLAAAGITKGCGSSRYCQERSLSRAEMASFLVRMLSGGGDPPPAIGEGDPVGGDEAPADAVVIRPSDNAQKLINQHPAGTAFLLKAGVHRRFSVEPKNGNAFFGEQGAVVSGAEVLTDFDRTDGAWVVRGQKQQAPFHGKCESGTACQMAEGVWMDGKELRQVTSRSALRSGTFYFDYGNDSIYLSDDPRGRLVETSVAQHAFFGHADDIAILGLTIEKYATPAQAGGVEPALHNDPGLDWSILDSEIRFVHGAAVKLGTGMIIRDTFIHHNGWMGIHGSSGFHDARVEKSELAHNCVGGFLCFGWGGGGLKAGQGSNLLIVNTASHHNHGKGLHLDNGMSSSRVVDNHVYDNHGAGIMFEISSGGVIEGNLVERNGFKQPNGTPGPGIGVLSSQSVEVRDNRVYDNGHGVVVRRTSRGAVDKVTVASNEIEMESGVTGVYDDTGSGVYNQDITFVSNAYTLGSKKRYYYWAGSQRTASEWRSYGNDVNGQWK